MYCELLHISKYCLQWSKQTQKTNVQLLSIIPSFFCSFFFKFAERKNDKPQITELRKCSVFFLSFILVVVFFASVFYASNLLNWIVTEGAKCPMYICVKELVYANGWVLLKESEGGTARMMNDNYSTFGVWWLLLLL